MSSIYNIEKLCDVNLTNPSNFQSLIEVVIRRSDTQLQVTEHFN